MSTWEPVRLRLVERDGHYQGEPVRSIRIFDPHILPEASVQRYEDVVGRGLLFEGRMERGHDAPVHLRDVRVALLLP